VSTAASETTVRWSAAWLDGVAFVIGLAVAWFAKWRTTDLVWSLWLSSLTVGYAMIVWRLSAPLREFGVNAPREQSPGTGWAKAATGGLLGVGFLLGLAFFTVHFGGFHLVHSMFLNYFFPLDPHAARGFPTLATYAEVTRRYWVFLPVAFLAERGAFRRPEPDHGAVTPEAIARRKARGDPMMQPYKNVIRLHLLIFFFAFAHFARLENFAIYAVVYAAYFFPWRLLRGGARGPGRQV
jgi:hypothetical protein